MALLFADGFDHYNTLNQKWTNSSGSLIATAAKRNGTQGCQINVNGQIGKSLPYSNTFFIGCAVQGNPAGGGLGGQLYELSAMAISGAQVEIFNIKVLTDGSISLFSQGGNFMGNTGTIGTPFFMSVNVFYYIEWAISLTGTPITVTATLKVNGVTYLSGLTSLTTVATNGLVINAAAADFHQFSSIASGSTYIDDLYINNGAAVAGQAFANSFRGDIRVGPYLVPRADNTIAWTPSTPGPSWSLLNEVPPDGDTTYVADFNATDIDDFFMTTVASLSGSIQAAHACYFARKDNEGTRGITPTVAGATQSGAPQFFLSDDYYYYTYPMDVDPSSGSVWTPSGINAQVFGAEVTT